MAPVIEVEDLRKAYRSLVAVDGVSFQVADGEIFGLVGPNGAGKTTAIECIEGMRRRDGGRVRVLGMDPETAGNGLKKRMGVQLQEAALPDRLRVWEILDLYASFYPRPAAWPPLLKQLGLSERRRAFFGKLSGGQKQRLFIALALINNPQVVFLDELTTGLDPQARRAMWELVRDIRGRGVTVFLTTHFMEEAERLCDRVAIMDGGRFVALDTPENLIRGLGTDSLIGFTVQGDPPLGPLQGLQQVSRVEKSGDRVTVYGRGDTLVATVVNALTASGIRFRDLRTSQPTLEDVFLAVTGKEMRD